MPIKKLQKCSMFDWSTIRLPTRCASKFHSAEAAIRLSCHPLALDLRPTIDCVHSSAAI